VTATITTVSRYMKHVMWRYGVDARVIPNGIPDAWLRPMRHRSSAIFSRLFQDRIPLVKVARWDPDKRWHMAVDAIVELKRLGMRPVFLARGGLESHGREVLDRATRSGLKVLDAFWTGTGEEALAEAIRPVLDADMIVLQSHLSANHSRALFHAADAVLANSGVEPFGLVGLETMAVGGVAMVGCTGEDYATHGDDAITLQTSDPLEVVHHVRRLRHVPAEARRLRRSARRSATRYSWPSVIERAMLPVLNHLDARRTPAYAQLDTFSGRPAPVIAGLMARPASARSGNERAGEGPAGRTLPDRIPA
jgi:glycosyltransferase involved in cell wall biosynthesis